MYDECGPTMAETAWPGKYEGEDRRLRELEAQNRALLEQLANVAALRPAPILMECPPEVMQAAIDEVRKRVAEAFAAILAERLLSGDAEFVECAQCAANADATKSAGGLGILLCTPCMTNRATISRLRAECERLRTATPHA